MEQRFLIDRIEATQTAIKMIAKEFLPVILIWPIHRCGSIVR